MTRTEFIQAYTKRSGISDEWAPLGFVEIDGRYLLAMPCGCESCEDEECEGWAMVSPTSIDHHLRFYAPEALRAAYRECLDV